MIIRNARADDIAAIHRLIGQLGYSVDEGELRARFDRVSASVDHRIVVAELNGKVVGVLHVFDRPALEKACEAVVQALVVDDEHRSVGIGEALMREAEAWTQGRKLPSTSLYSRTDRHRAHAFYERMGYRVKGTSVLMARAL